MITADTITDAQILECVPDIGYPPDASAVRCPKCSYGPGWQCRNSRGMVTRTHVARERAVKRAYVIYIARCIEILNARAKAGAP